MARLVKRGSYWSIVFDEGKRQIWRSTGLSNKHEAEKLLASEMVRRRHSLVKDIQKITFERLANKWLEMHKPDKKAKTIASYSEQVRIHLIPFFGHSLVNNILPEDVESFKQELSKKVSPTTTNYNLRLLRSIFEMGIRWGYAVENAAKRVKRLKQYQRQRQPLSKEQVTKLLDVCEGKDKTVLMTAILTGLRLGELLCMKWRNLDWKAGTYTVAENLSHGIVSIPKTEASYRKVSLPKILLKTLKQHKIEQNKQILANREKWENNDLIFPTVIGTFQNPNNLRRRVFYPALDKAKLPRIRLHDLRGTFATLQLESHPNPKTVQQALGHKSARVTLEIYAQVNDQLRKQAANDLESHIYGVKKSRSAVALNNTAGTGHRSKTVANSTSIGNGKAHKITVNTGQTGL